MSYQVAGGFQAPFPGSEFLAAGGANDCTTSLQDSAYRIPAELLDHFSPLYHPLISFAYPEDTNAKIKRCSDSRTQSRIHSWRISATCKDSDLIHNLPSPGRQEGMPCPCIYSVVLIITSPAWGFLYHDV